MANTGFTITIANDHVKDVLEELAKRRTVSLELCGQQAERNAKINIEHSPRRVDTGLLRNSVTHALAGEGPAISSYSGDNPSRYGGDGSIPSGSYSGSAPDGVDTVYIGTNVEYAIYVHEGTQRMSPNHFIRDAMGPHKEEYKKIIEQVLKGQQQ